jgi:hypothetical protein
MDEVNDLTASADMGGTPCKGAAELAVFNTPFQGTPRLTSLSSH